MLDKIRESKVRSKMKYKILAVMFAVMASLPQAMAMQQFDHTNPPPDPENYTTSNIGGTVLYNRKTRTGINVGDIIEHIGEAGESCMKLKKNLTVNREYLQKMFDLQKDGEPNKSTRLVRKWLDELEAATSKNLGALDEEECAKYNKSGWDIIRLMRRNPDIAVHDINASIHWIE
jgi:hypothetical protein